MKQTVFYNEFHTDEYMQGYSDGFSKGYNPMKNGTFILPQEIRIKKNYKYIGDYKRGYGKGFLDGHRCDPYYNYYNSYSAVIELPDFLYGVRINNIQENTFKKNRNSLDPWLEIHFNRVVDVFGTHIDSALFMSLKKSCTRCSADNREIIAAISESNRNPSSFIPFLSKFIKAYLLRLFYIELTALYDSIPIYKIDEDIEKSAKDFAEVYQLHCKNIDPREKSSEALKKVYRSTATRRTKENLNALFKIAMSTHLPKKCITSQKDVQSLSTYHRTFDLCEYVANSFVLMSLKSDRGHTPEIPSPSFSAYIAFLADKLTKKRNLFAHCEKYKEKQCNANTHNQGRDFSDVTEKYNNQAAKIDLILKNICLNNLNSNSLSTEYLSSEFLFNSQFLKNQFFCSLNSKLFEYLSNKIDISSYLKEVAASSEESIKSKTNRYYLLLEYLRFFDIDMCSLESCTFSSDEDYDCSKLMSLIAYEDISQNLEIPIDFILAFLHEVYTNRGDILSDALQEFNSRQNLLFDYHNAVQHYQYITGNTVTAVSNLSYGYGSSLQFSESKKMNSFAKFLSKHLSFYFTELKNIDVEKRLKLNNGKPTTNQALLINHLVHLSAFDGPI